MEPSHECLAAFHIWRKRYCPEVGCGELVHDETGMTIAFAEGWEAALAARDAENKALRAYVVKAEQVFRHYGDLHAAKPDMEKAARNYAMADEALAALGGQP